MMDREFTPREKGMLLLLAVLLLALGYMKLFYAPVQQAVEDNQQRQTELQDQALIEQTRALKMQVMEKELEELKAGNAVPDAQVPDYDNVQRVMIELNAILARAQEYSLAFDDVSLDDSGLVRRPVELTFKTATMPPPGRSSTTCTTAAIAAPSRTCPSMPTRTAPISPPPPAP